MEGLVTGRSFINRFGDEGLTRWQRELPGIEDVRVTSSVDGAEQAVLWMPPQGEAPQPLLVGLHSWSSAYRQHVNIPFGIWARYYGWGFIQPNFRGVNDGPEAMGSDLAVQDVIDAIDYAIERGGIDPNRVYVVGFSGGGMMSLLLAGRHPDRIAGAAAWTPVYDLVDFYRHAAENQLGYRAQIVSGCGGAPTQSDPARIECEHRSPSTHLDTASSEGVPVFVAHGLADRLVPPDHAARAFNQVASDPLPEEVIADIARNRLPEGYSGSVEGESHFGEADPTVFFARTSGSATLVLFEGDHNMVYHPALEWFLRLSELTPAG